VNTRIQNKKAWLTSFLLAHPVEMHITSVSRKSLCSSITVAAECNRSAHFRPGYYKSIIIDIHHYLLQLHKTGNNRLSTRLVLVQRQRN